MATLFLVSETTPTNPANLQGWIKPSTGAMYQYIGGRWIPLSGGNPQTYNLPLTVLMRGVNKTLDVKSLSITDNLTNKIDKVSLVFDSDSNYIPQEGEEVVIIRGTTNKIFGGNISKIVKKERAPGSISYIYIITCVDFSAKMKKEKVVESYSSQTCASIIADIFDKYCSELSYNNIQTGPTIDFIQFNYKDSFSCIKELAKISGYNWYIDADKDLHFFSFETNSAPYDINETSASGSHKNFDITIDKSQVKNWVIIQGGYYYSDDFEDIITVGDSTETAWTLKYSPSVADSGSIEAHINTGAGYVSKDLGIDNIDDGSTDDLLINRTEKIVKQADGYNATAGDLIKIIYKYKIPIITQDKRQSSIDAIKAIEGGNGKYVYQETNKEIETISAAHEYGQSILNDYADVDIKGSFTTHQDGYRSGQLLNINKFGYENSYLIQSVKTKWVAGDVLEYKIKFAGTSLGLTEFLTNLYEAGKEIVVREDETIHKLESFPDNIILGDSSSSYITTISDITNMPTVPSICCDSVGHLHIAYYTPFLPQFGYCLFYAKYVDGWMTAGIESNLAGTEESCDIWCDSNDDIHIAFCNQATHTVRHAKHTGTWTVSDVVNRDSAYAGICCDSNDYPAIIYAGPDLYCSIWDGSSWTESLIESSINYIPDIAVDSNDCFYVVYSGIEGLKCAKYIDSWNTEIISGEGGDQRHSIAIDNSNMPHVVYCRDSTTWSLRYAKWSGASWDTEEVTNQWEEPFAAQHREYYPCIETDNQDRPIIIYVARYVVELADGFNTHMVRYEDQQWKNYTLAHIGDSADSDIIGNNSTAIFDNYIYNVCKGIKLRRILCQPI